MILGKLQTLQVVRKKDFGIYLSDSSTDDADAVLLPKKQVPENISIGDSIEVFLYKDSSDRLIATTNKPILEVGEVGRLRVKELTRIGAFLDNGLEKDVLLPFKETEGKLEAGGEVLVALYEDRSKRLAATMRIYNYLEKSIGVAEGEEVTGTVYDIKPMGVFVAVYDRFYGLIPKQEVYTKYNIGDSIEARVLKVRDDGKINLSPRKKAYMQLDIDAELIYEKLEQAGGSLDISDSSSPERIKERLGISKAAFKRAAGHLLKEGKIKILENSIQKA